MPLESLLESRCRVLLLAYPASYREDRGAEIIGTLLEATPENRAWPLLRDVLAIAAGGLAARYAISRQRTLAANVRTGVVVGVAAFLCLDTAPFGQFAGPIWLGPALIAAAVGLAFACPWRALTLAAALPAAVLIWLAPPSSQYLLGEPPVVVPCLALLVILAGGPEQAGTRWLWAVGAIAAAPWLIGLGEGELRTALVPAVLAVVSFGWIVVDARPALAGAVFVLAVWLSWVFSQPVWPAVSGAVTAVVLAIVAVVAAPAVWLLRTQSAR